MTFLTFWIITLVHVCYRDIYRNLSEIYRLSGYLRVSFFFASYTLKPCIKSMRINISRNHSKSLNLPDLQETVSNLRECIFLDFDILANIAEN